jgi:hypothetical protein
LKMRTYTSLAVLALLGLINVDGKQNIQNMI